MAETMCSPSDVKDAVAWLPKLRLPRDSKKITYFESNSHLSVINYLIFHIGQFIYKLLKLSISRS